MSTQVTNSSRRNRGTIIKLVLAGVAVLGVGAALTTAAWTDQAWFSAEATAGDVELQAALPDATGTGPGTFIDADDLADAVVIPLAPEYFENIAPGEAREVTLWLRNDGSLPLTIESAAAQDVTGPLFAGTAPATITVGAIVGEVLDPEDEVSFTVTVTAPDWGDADTGYQGATGAFNVVVTGTTD